MSGSRPNLLGTSPQPPRAGERRRADHTQNDATRRGHGRRLRLSDREEDGVVDSVDTAVSADQRRRIGSPTPGVSVMTWVTYCAEIPR